MRIGKQKLASRMWESINPKSITEIYLVAVPKGIKQYLIGVFGVDKNNGINYLLEYQEENISLDTYVEREFILMYDIFSRKYYGKKVDRVLQVMQFNKNIILNCNTKPSIEMYIGVAEWVNEEVNSSFDVPIFEDERDLRKSLIKKWLDNDCWSLVLKVPQYFRANDVSDEMMTMLNVFWSVALEPKK